MTKEEIIQKLKQDPTLISSRGNTFYTVSYIGEHGWEVELHPKSLNLPVKYNPRSFDYMVDLILNGVYKFV